MLVVDSLVVESVWLVEGVAEDDVTNDEVSVAVVVDSEEVESVEVQDEVDSLDVGPV